MGFKPSKIFIFTIKIFLLDDYIKFILIDFHENLFKICLI